MRIVYRFGVALLGGSVAAGCAAQHGMNQPGAPRPSTAGSAAVMPAPGAAATPAATGPGVAEATAGAFGAVASSIKGGATKVVDWCTPTPTIEPAPDPIALSSSPGKISPELHIAMAEMKERSGQVKQAREHYEAALKLSPKNLSAQLGVAHLLDREGKLKEATEKYQVAAKQHPREARVWNDLGLCYARQKKFDDAQRALAKAVELEPLKPLFRNNQATVLIEMGRTNDALAQFKATHNPAVAHYNLAYLLYQKGNKKLAAEHFALSAAADPTFQPASDWVAKLAAEGAGAPPEHVAAPVPAQRPITAPVQVAANGDAVRQSYLAEPQPPRTEGYEPYYRNQLRREAEAARVTTTANTAPNAGVVYPNTTAPAFTEDRIATAPRPLPPVDKNEGLPAIR